MANTPNYNLYMPNRADNLPVDNTLSNNFLSIDNILNGLDTTLKNIILESETSSAETVQARGEFDILGDRLDSMEEVVVNANAFGVKKDGITNDSPNLQAALNYINSVGGGTVYIPKGTYNLKTVLQVYKNTTIDMHPQAELILDSVSPAYRHFINGEYGNDNYASGYNGEGNITIRGGILNCNGWVRACISFAHGRNILIENVTMKNITDGHCMELCALNGVIIRNCRLVNFKNVDITRNYVEAIQIDVCTSTAFPSFGSYDNTENQNIVVEKCYFGKDDTAPVGYGPVFTGVGSHGADIGKWNKNIVVRDCVFDGMTYAGVRGIQWNDLTVENNRFYNCAVGVLCETKNLVEQDYKNIRVEGNSFYSCGFTNDCIRIVGDNSVNKRVQNVFIRNNYIENVNTGFNAINVGVGDNVVIDSNVVNGARRCAFISTVNNASITNNKGSNTLFQFATSFECKNIIIMGNQCFGMGDAALTIRSTQVGQIRNNLFIDCAVSNGAIYIYEASSVHSTDFLIHDNVIGTGTLNTQCQYGLYVATGGVNIRHYNNILKGSVGMANTVAPGGVIITKADGTQTYLGVNASNVVTFTSVT